MKRNVLFAALLAAALVFGLGGCSSDSDDSGFSFDYTNYETWEVIGTPLTSEIRALVESGLGGYTLEDMGLVETYHENIYIMFTHLPPEGVAQFHPLNTWTLKIDAARKFRFDGNLLDMDTEAYGKLAVDPDEPDFFMIQPSHGTWHNVPENDGGDANGDKSIDSGTLSSFVGYINAIPESDPDIWIMDGPDLSMFNQVWKKK